MAALTTWVVATMYIRSGSFPAGGMRIKAHVRSALSFVKCLLGLRSPRKMISFLHKLIEGKPSLIEA
jgi:hypothetical protein